MNCEETDLMNRSKGHFKVGKVRFQVLPKCIASFSFSYYCYQILMVLMVISNNRKVRFGPLLSIYANIS